MNSRTPIKSILFPLSAVCIVVAALVVATSKVDLRRADSVDCSGDYWNSSDPQIINVCGEQKLANMLSEVEELATAIAEPSIPPVPYTPGPILPLPDAFKIVEEVDRRPENGALPVSLHNATSIWWDGSVPYSDYRLWDQLMVVTRPGNGYTFTLPLAGGGGVITPTNNPTLETIVWGSVGGDPAVFQYEKKWESPEPVGKLIITNITNPSYTNTDPTVPYPGPQSVVYFTTPSGRTGSFDMAAEQWTFDSP